MKPVSVLATLMSLIPIAVWAGPVDINTADAATLDKELKGVGPARAQAIVAYRTQHGPFKSADDLSLVKTIPQKVVDQNRDNIQLGGGPRSAQAAKPVEKPAAKTPPASR
jgi:competence protein ComEA